MEIRPYTYEEFPEFLDDPEGSVRIKTTGDEIAVQYHHDVEYAVVDGIPLHLQILRPETLNEPDKKYPCVVYVQGSAWLEQNRFQEICMLSALAKYGYVIAVVQYRHSGQAPFPAQIQDAKNAIRFMRKNAADYNVNPDQIIISGDSSGGHTAVFCELIKDGTEMDRNEFPGVSAETKGVLNYYGAVSLLMSDGYPTTLNVFQADAPDGMLLGHVDVLENIDLARKATAVTHITPEIDLPPFCIIHGTKDRIANTRLSAQLYTKLKECGKDVRLYLVEGADHGGGAFWSKEMCDIADEFIQYCLSK